MDGRLGCRGDHRGGERGGDSGVYDWGHERVVQQFDYDSHFYERGGGRGIGEHAMPQRVRLPWAFAIAALFSIALCVSVSAREFDWQLEPQRDAILDAL